MMRYRRFGKTELQMPVLTCGGMRFQQQWKDCPLEEIISDSQANLEAVIARALELGMNHFETARGYGTSEMQLGRILPNLERDKIIVQTKVSPMEKVDDFLKDFETSMDYLRLEKVDLLGLHGINNREVLDWSLKPGGCREAAQKLRAEGRVDYIGFSTHGPTEIIVEAIESGLFDYVNLHWYYIFQDNWAAIEAASKLDMGVFIISPNDKGGKLFQPPQKLVDLCVPLKPMIFNDLFCLSRPAVHTLSIGAAKPEDYDEHIKSLEYLDNATEVITPIVERLDAEMEKCLGREWITSWKQGLPNPEETPGQINIPVILFLRNLALAFDMIEYGKMRFNLFGGGGHWFPGAKVESSEQLSAQALHGALSHSPHADKIPGYLQQAYEMFKSKDLKRISQSD